jgi:hypothetical protein
LEVQNAFFFKPQAMKKPEYSKLIKDFLPKHVANFKALPKEEALRRALAQHKLGKEYARCQSEKSGKKPS